MHSLEIIEFRPYARRGKNSTGKIARHRSRGVRVRLPAAQAPAYACGVLRYARRRHVNEAASSTRGGSHSRQPSCSPRTHAPRPAERALDACVRACVRAYYAHIRSGVGPTAMCPYYRHYAGQIRRAMRHNAGKLPTMPTTPLLSPSSNTPRRGFARLHNTTRHTHIYIRTYICNRAVVVCVHMRTRLYGRRALNVL